ncbi:MAG: hypothetical protein HC927_12025 [Deltaproteobacteria bacterium]|nr:hypothetical protein [Deltaproteobacteria bacterium]
MLADVPERIERRKRWWSRVGVGVLLLGVYAATLGLLVGEREVEVEPEVVEVAAVPTSGGDVEISVADLDAAIEAAQRGRALDAWAEFVRVDDERYSIDCAQALQLVEELLAVAPTLPDGPAYSAYEVAEKVAKRVEWLAASSEDDDLREKAIALQELARIGMNQ